MSHVQRFDHVGITVGDLTSDGVLRRTGSRGRGADVRRGRVRRHRHRYPGLAQRDPHAAAARRWNWAGTLQLRQARPPARDRSPRWPTNSAYAMWPSRSPTSRRSSTCWLRTVTGWSAILASTRTTGGWPTCAGPRASSCPLAERIGPRARRPATGSSSRGEFEVAQPMVGSVGRASRDGPRLRPQRRPPAIGPGRDVSWKEGRVVVEHFHPQGKMPSRATVEAQRAVRAVLSLHDERDFAGGPAGVPRGPRVPLDHGRCGARGLEPGQLRLPPRG